MGLSYEQSKQLGLAHEHPDDPSRRQAVTKRSHVPRVNDRGQNKTEARFDALLDDLKREGLIRGYWFEPLKLRLAGRTWYRVDFVVSRRDGSLACVEVKGHMRDDAAVKLKVAAEAFPFAEFFVVFADKACWRGWDLRRVDRGGIGLAPVGCGWLNQTERG